MLIAHIFLEYTKHGRFIYAMGGNKQAAKLSGINVKAYRYLAGMITAVFVAIGGILVASRCSSAQVMCCDNYLMRRWQPCSSAARSAARKDPTRWAP